MTESRKFSIQIQTVDDSGKICLILQNNETGKVPAFMVFNPGWNWDNIARTINLWGLALLNKEEVAYLLEQSRRIFIQMTTSLN